jgi:acyl-CoA thioesterase
VADPSSDAAPLRAGGAAGQTASADRAGGAAGQTGGEPLASGRQAPLNKFDRDTAVWREDAGGPARARTAVKAAASNGTGAGAGRALFGAEIASDWRAGRGPHGGYLAAILLRALVESVADEARAPRSLTIHYARAPEPGPVQITTTVERAGRSLTTLSARMHQGEDLIALVLGAFSLPWGGPEISQVQMPAVEPADPSREGVKLIEHGGPEFARQLVLQPRMEGTLFAGGEQAMEVRAWLGLAEPRPIDALSLAFFADALIPAPYMRLPEPAAVPTIDLTVHFQEPMPREAQPDPRELCLAQTRSELIHDGFFVEDGMIWAGDGTLLAQSRQLAIVIPFAKR